MKTTDVLVIGAGPAGLSAAGYAARAGYDTVVYDAMAPGGQLLLIDELENYPGAGTVKGFELAEKLENQAVSFGVEVEYAAITAVKKEGDRFIVTTEDGDVEAKAVIIATGAKHRELGAVNEEKYQGRGVSYCATCDGPFFKDKRIVVVGGGDTALTDALYLAKLASHVTIVHRRTEYRAQKVLVDRVKSNEKISEKLGFNVKEIVSDDGKAVTGVILDNGERIDTDGVFIFVGIKPNTEFLTGLCEMDRGFIVTDGMMRTSVDGLFAAGDVRTTPFRQVVTATGDGAIAAHAADEYISNLAK